MERKADHVVDIGDVGRLVFDTLYAILHIPVSGPCEDQQMVAWLSVYSGWQQSVVIFVINIGTSPHLTTATLSQSTGWQQPGQISQLRVSKMKYQETINIPSQPQDWYHLASPPHLPSVSHHSASWTPPLCGGGSEDYWRKVVIINY